MKRLKNSSTHPKDGRRIVHFASQAAWEMWLGKYSISSDGIWIKFAKKDSGIASVSYAQALDVALCYGWIDSLLLRLDERFYLQRFTPRGPRSRWSKINCDKATALIISAKMRPRGLKEVEAAKKDGRWDRAYHGARKMPIPPDLKKELKKNPRASRFFATLSSSNRYAILFRLHDAKKPETRLRRLGQFIAMLNEGKTLH